MNRHLMLADLNRATGMVPTPRGPIETSVRREGENVHADEVLPPDTTAEFALPGQAVSELGWGEHSVQ